MNKLLNNKYKLIKKDNIEIKRKGKKKRIK